MATAQTYSAESAVDSKGLFQFKEKTGDLFACPSTESMAHCVGEDMIMAKGIARLFRNRFQNVAELKAQGKHTGDVAVLNIQQRFIYYLVIKTEAKDKPTYDTLKSSLEAMKEHCLANSVGSISMPQLGCGLNALKWNQVSNIIKRVFEDTDIMITIYAMPPADRSPAPGV